MVGSSSSSSRELLPLDAARGSWPTSVPETGLARSRSSHINRGRQRQRQPHPFASRDQRSRVSTSRRDDAADRAESAAERGRTPRTGRAQLRPPCSWGDCESCKIDVCRLRARGATDQALAMTFVASSARPPRARAPRSAGSSRGRTRRWSRRSSAASARSPLRAARPADPTPALLQVAPSRPPRVHDDITRLEVRGRVLEEAEIFAGCVMKAVDRHACCVSTG